MAQNTKARRSKVWDKTGGLCWYCGIGLIADPYTSSLSQFCIDHVIPLSKGGKDRLSNLVPSCRHCNCSKHAKSVEEFRFMLASKGIPRFTDEHIAYLKKFDITLPDVFPCYPTILFWFEEQGKVL